MSITKSQESKSKKFKRFLEESIMEHQKIKYDAQVINWEVTETDYGPIWISAQIDLVGLPEGNLLRALDKEFWHIHIGRKGKITVYNSPKCYDQFKGQRAFEMFFKK